MLSLREKLRASMPEAAKPKKKANDDCFIRERRLPARGLLDAEILDSETLYRITGEMQEPCSREEILFLDTETTGLSGGAGTLAFEVGTGWFCGDEFIIRQYVMRDYNEEGPMLQHILQDMEGKTVFCTFNGKTFDVPLLTSRMIMNRLRIREARQLDLLHIARRVWKLRLGRCNLTRLEEAVLGRERDDDLPGAQVPERFFNYLKTGDFSLFEDVLDHNFQDVASLSEILNHLIGAHNAPGEHLKEAEDAFSMGNIMLKRGRFALSRECYHLADQGKLSAPAHERLALSYKKESRWQEAADVYRQMIKAGQGRLLPYVELAKIYEHRLNEPERALKVTEAAIRGAQARDEEWLPALEKRYLRLIKKTRRT